MLRHAAILVVIACEIGLICRFFAPAAGVAMDGLDWPGIVSLLGSPFVLLPFARP